MPQPSYPYTIVTAEGDRNIKAKDHHADFNTIEEWLKKNMPFTVAFKAGDEGTVVKGIYEGRDRSGAKVM